MNLRARLFTFTSSLVLVLLPACGGESAPARPVSDVPERFYLASAPPSAQSVSALVAAAKDGDEIVVTGRVGGAQKVFVDGYAAFTIIDARIPACGERSSAPRVVAFDAGKRLSNPDGCTVTTVRQITIGNHL